MRMSYVSGCIDTSCVDSLGMTSSSINRSLGRLTEYHLHQLLFFNFYLHQLQLPHLASSSQLPFAIDAKGGKMFKGRDVLVRGSLLSVVINEKGGDCWSGCVLCLSLMSTESLIEVLSFV